jgi:ribosomal protein L11 methyltransferase
VKDFLLEISFDAADAALEELVQARLFLTRSTGNSTTQRGGTTTVSAYFESMKDRDAAVEQLAGLNIDLSRKELDRIDWLERYQQSLRPIYIGKRFVVVPEAKLVQSAGEGAGAPLRLIIPQQQAFGTGSHQSTALAIELLESIDMRGARGLDIGSGSGILALAMLALGARKAIALDVDPDAYRPLRENRMRNRVPADRMPFFIGELKSLREAAFDVIAINILPEVIIPVLPQVVAHLAGTLIVSGILTVHRADVIFESERSGLRLEEQLEKGEWWAGSFRLSAS